MPSRAITYTGDIVWDISEQIIHTRYIDVEQKDHYHDDHQGDEDDSCEPEDHRVLYDLSEAGTHEV